MIRPHPFFMLIITNQPDKYKKEKAEGHEIAWALALNTGASWIRHKYPDRGYVHHRALYGTASGACLILGYGPSRSSFVVDKVDIPVFAINRAVDVCPDADYWCAHDIETVKSHAWLRPAGSTLVTQGASAILPGFMEASDGFRVVVIDAEPDPSRWPYETRPLYWNETTFGWVIHLAIRMGFTEIFTLGVDLSLGGYKNPTMDDTELRRQHVGVRERTLRMFEPEEKKLWYDAPARIIDLSGGLLPVEKATL